jgi:arylsulfatase A-like enzyme
MATHFKSLGYRTAAFLNKTKLGQDPGLAHDFDVFSVAESNEGDDPMPETVRSPVQVVEELAKFLDTKDTRPSFVWLVFNDPHRPYRPPEPFLGIFAEEEVFDRGGFRGGVTAKKRDLPAEHSVFLNDVYDEEVNYVDHAVNRLLAVLRERGLFDSTVIVVTADHGEELGENGGRWGHCIRCTMEEALVPLLIKLPGQNEGVVVSEPVQIIDIFPTLAHLAESEPPGDLEGTSLMPLIKGETHSAQTDRVAACFWQDSELLVLGDHALETDAEGSMLYSLSTRETVDDRPDLIQKILDAGETIAHDPGGEAAIARKEMIEQMRAIGYIQ